MIRITSSGFMIYDFPENYDNFKRLSEKIKGSRKVCRWMTTGGIQAWQEHRVVMFVSLL